MTDKLVQLVFSNPVEGKEAEFNEWYDNVHLRDVLAIPGVLTAQRFDLCDAEITRGEGLPAPTHRYLTIYEMEGDVDGIMAKIQAAVASGAMFMSDSLDLTTATLSFWLPRGPKVSA
jgi:hypothetical protein